MVPTIINSSYDEETGVSTVTVGSHWGTFTRTVKVQEEDKHIANRWDGCHFAYYLCLMDVHRAKGKALLERSAGITHAANVLECSLCDSSRDLSVADSAYIIEKLHKQAECLRREGKKSIDKADAMKAHYFQYVDRHLKMRAKFMKEEEDRLSKESVDGR